MAFSSFCTHRKLSSLLISSSNKTTAPKTPVQLLLLVLLISTTATSPMGIFSWFKGTKNDTNSKPATSEPVKTQSASEVTGMNGAVEVRRPGPPPADITVFEFGSVAASADNVTLAGFCPVSDELEPCRWEILPAQGSDAPQFRVVF